MGISYVNLNAMLEGLPGLACLPVVSHLSSEMVDLVPSDFNEVALLSLFLVWLSFSFLYIMMIMIMIFIEL